MKIHLFQQCLIDMFYPHVGMAGVEVLERLGCDLVVPKKQVCCGQMFTNSGYNDAAMDAIKNTIECFENAEYVVSMSGSCAFAIRDEYHHFLKDQPEWLARAEKLSGKIYEFTEFITDVLANIFYTQYISNELSEFINFAAQFFCASQPLRLIF